MGKIKIVGEAVRKIKCNAMRVELTFFQEQDELNNAIKKMMEEVEIFIKVLNKKGIETNQLHLSEDDINYDEDENELFMVTRSIVLYFSFDMSLCDFILNVIEKKQLNVRMDIQYYHTDEKKMKQELMKEALLDAKEKAELLAQTLNQRIIGVESMVDDGYYDYDDDESFITRPILGYDEIMKEPSLMSAPIKALRQRIQVVWLIE